MGTDRVAPQALSRTVQAMDKLTHFARLLDTAREQAASFPDLPEEGVPLKEWLLLEPLVIVVLVEDHVDR